MNGIHEEIMRQYGLIRIAEGYWRTAGGRAYIKEVGEEYRIYSCNGNYVTTVKNFRLAVIRAESV